MAIQTVNPATGEIIKTYEIMDSKEYERIIDQCHDAFLEWRTLDFADRSKRMLNVAELLIKNKNKYAKIITQEMGKIISQSISEIEKCAWTCDHFAKNSEQYLKPRFVKTEMSKSYVTYKPLGIVFAIMPWNFPFWQVFRFSAPALMAGNAALLKHAPISTGTALMIEEIYRKAGMPKNLFRALILDNDTAAKVIAHPKIAAVTLTGSQAAGREVGSEAVQSLKKIVLELGGSDPYLILEDADLEQAAEAVVNSRLNNSGQVCIAAKRVIVVKRIFEDFQNLILSKIKKYHMGNPMDDKDDKNNFGPMAREDLRKKLHDQVLASIAKGAQLLAGGEIRNLPGFYYPPTVLTNVKKGMPAYEEELFGPVIAIISAKNEKEAIVIANDTKFGLAAAVFTKDLKRGEIIATEHIEAGTCFVNDFVRSDPRLPFGGIKNSGFGHELSEEGIKEFVNAKTIAIK